MAVVGEAFIIIKPITAGFEGSVRRDLNRLSSVAGNAGAKAGKTFGGAFGRAFGPSGAKIFSNDFIGKSIAAQKQFASLNRAGIFLQSTISVLLSSLGSLVTGLVSLGAAAAGAAPSLLVLGSVLVSIGAGAAVAKLALSGIGAAVSKLNKQTKGAEKDLTAQERRVRDARKNLLRTIRDNKEAIVEANKTIKEATEDATEAQEALNKALEAGKEELQQLGFDAEDAALAEVRAANELEDARKTLARVQDLPPNSRARREAELAFREADLNLRRAKDKNRDLATEQERLAKTGVEGLDSVISARKAKAEADKAVGEAREDLSKAERNAAEREADARENLQDAKDDLAKAKAGGDGSGADDPLAGLTESQKKFAKFIASLKPKIDELKEIAAGAFLPGLTEAIQLIVDKAWPTITKGVEQIGTALGKAAVSIAKAITESGNLKDLGTVFEDAAENIEILGRIIGNVWGIFLSYLIALDPLTKKFLEWLEKSSAEYEAFLDTEEGISKLTEFFNLAGEIAGEIGDVFRETFGALGTLIEANFAPGGAGWFILDWLERILADFNAFGDTAEGQKTLQEFFLSSAENATAALESIGAFIKEILKAGADPNLKIFWDTLKQGAPIFGSILTKTNEAAPSFATFIVNFLKIIDLLTESSTIKTFFDTLNVGLGILIKVLESPVVAAILKVLGPISGFLLAMGALIKVVKFFGFVLSGILIGAFNLVVGAIGVIMTVFRVLKTVLTVVTTGFRLLAAAMIANPIGAVIALIVALVAIFVVLYNKNEGFREAVQRVWAAIKDAIGAAFEFIKGVFDKIAEIGGKIWDFILDGLKLIWSAVEAEFTRIFNFFKAIVEIFIGIGLIIWDFLFDKIKAVWDLVSGWWNNTILPFITGIVDKVKAFGAKIWDWIFDKISAVWNTVKGFWDNTIYPFVSGVVNAVKTRASAIWNFISDALSTAWNKVKGFWDNTIYPFISNIKNRITNLAAGLWDGLKNGLESVVNFVIRGVNLIIKGINLLIRAANRVKIGSDIQEIREILPVNFAKGGIVFPSQGGTLARVAEAGRPERIEPLDPDGLSKRDKAMINLLTKGGTAGATFNIYPSQGMDEVELASMISRQIAFQTRRGAA
jgi:hypothetical protein